MGITDRDWYKEWWRNRGRNAQTARLRGKEDRGSEAVATGRPRPIRITPNNHHTAIRVANFLAPFFAVGWPFLLIGSYDRLYSSLLDRWPTIQSVVASFEVWLHSAALRATAALPDLPWWSILIAWPILAFLGGWVAWCFLYLFARTCLMPRR